MLAWQSLTWRQRGFALLLVGLLAALFVISGGPDRPTLQSYASFVGGPLMFASWLLNPGLFGGFRARAEWRDWPLLCKVLMSVGAAAIALSLTLRLVGPGLDPLTPSD